MAARQAITPAPEAVDNTTALGKLIYTKYVFLFQAAGLILLVAMIGAIVLTLAEAEHCEAAGRAEADVPRPEGRGAPRRHQAGAGGMSGQ